MDVDAARTYDAMADAYRADEGNAYNALYERPAMLALLGDVANARVLDAGCGAGALAAALLDRGAAEVVGRDIAPRMVALARARGLGPRATFAVGDLAAPLHDLPDGAFDRVAGSLVMHYLRDWDTPLGELRRVLAPGGRIVLSTHHPTMVARQWPAADPQATVLLEDRWEKAGRRFDVRFWARPLSAMAAAFDHAGLEVAAVSRPRPLAACRAQDPTAWARLSTQPWFLLVALQRCRPQEPRATSRVSCARR